MATPRKLLGLIDYHQSVLSFSEKPAQASKNQRDKQATMNVCHPSYMYIHHAHTESTCACMQTEITKVKTKCGDITDFEKKKTIIKNYIPINRIKMK